MTGHLCINLENLAANWQILNSNLSKAECGAVVKADAYGIGAIKTVEALLAVGCRTFFVATLEEAIELRDSIPLPFRLFVLGGQAAVYHDVCFRYQITPVLISLEQVTKFTEGLTHPEIKPAIKIDTGMGRFGLKSREILELVSINKELLISLNPSLLISHLACADTSGHPMNRDQLVSFSGIVEAMRQVLPDTKTSLSNSSGIFLGQSYQFDLVRPGLALYGGNPTPEKSNPMKAVVRLTLPVMQVKHLVAGDSVGYGADFVADKPCRIATAFGGYADGLLRSLAGKFYGYCQGAKVPMVGRVSMDSVSFDVSDIGQPDSMINEIEILGEHQGVDDLARAAGTISYEVLTSLGFRYHRRYIGGS